MASEEDAAAYYRAVLERLWRGGAMGALAWNYSDYPRDLWTEPPLDSALHERTFGVFRADGSPKPAVRVLRQFSRELSNGTLAKRLGPHGVAAVRLEVDPAEYYRDPASSLRRLYRRYLDALEAAGA
jgi:endo-1,4-beta-mannosidase